MILNQFIADTAPHYVLREIVLVIENVFRFFFYCKFTNVLGRDLKLNTFFIVARKSELDYL